MGTSKYLILSIFYVIFFFMIFETIFSIILKTWNRMRLTHKARIAKYKKWSRSTGNKAPPITLSSLDYQLDEIFGKFYDGLEIIPEVGVVKRQVNDQWKLKIDWYKILHNMILVQVTLFLLYFFILFLEFLKKFN